MRALTYVEIDIPRCILTYGIAPCIARLGVTGTRKCFNSIKTCQDRAHFTPQTITIRHAVPTSYLPSSIECIPDIKQIDFTPATISLGGNLGVRASVSVEFFDHRDSDTGAAGDKYLADRFYDPFKQGTYWGRFRARQPFLRGHSLRLIMGFEGQALSEMETRHYVIDSFEGLTRSGSFMIIAKDVLKLADGDRAQAPPLSNGYLNADIASDATTLTLAPAGIGNSDPYPSSGYVAIGGKEIVSFTRDPTAGNDASCLLLLHFDGADGSITFTDSSSYARTPGSIGGNAQIDTAQFFYGTSSLFDGVGDYIAYPDSDDWTFSGNFTIECHARFSSLSDIRTLFAHGSGTSANQYRLIVTTAGVLTFDVTSSSSTIVTMSSPSGEIVIDTWYHLAVVRNANVWRIYKDGISIATTTNSSALPNYTSSFVIGTDSPGANGMSGWLDEFRVSKVARWTTNFTSPNYIYNTSSDILTIIRAKFNTAAQAGRAQDRVQFVLSYSAEDPADIIADLLENYADVPPSYVPLAEWLEETADFLGVLYSAAICEPTSVNTLVSELVEQAALAIWWDDRAQFIRLQVLRAVSTTAAVFGDDVIISGSLSNSEQPDKRLSRVQTYFGQINPLRPLSDLDNYRSSAETIDADAETDYGSAAIKRITSRWIPALGRAVAEKLNQKQLSRFRDPPRKFGLSLLRESTIMPSLGGGYQIASNIFQDDTGAPVNVPIQVTRLKPSADRIVVDAEEMLFLHVSGDLGNRLIIVDVDTNDLNLRIAHDAIYPTPHSGDVVTCRINAGVIVGSTSTATSAFDVGSWPSGVSVTLIINGRIEGAGGQGGRGGDIVSNAGLTAGATGGVALYTRYAINVEHGAGAQIWGGGGGGGASAGSGSGGGIGGGGGAGKIPGSVGGDGAGSAPISEPQPGTTELGGAGGTSLFAGASGAGGNPGIAGTNGSGGSASAGGAAGKAIDGVSHVTVTSGSGDIRGGIIN